jgi:hypothetical protein
VVVLAVLEDILETAAQAGLEQQPHRVGPQVAVGQEEGAVAVAVVRQTVSAPSLHPGPAVVLVCWAKDQTEPAAGQAQVV